MGKIFLVLAIGFLIGFFGLVKEKGIRINSRLQTLWLLLLIFCMGVSIGRNGEVIQNLPALGGRALLFSVLTILGSIGVVFLISKVFLERRGEK